MTTAERAAQTRRAKRAALQITLVALPVSMYGLYTWLEMILLPTVAYFVGFLVYWVGWCLLLPLWVLGRQQLLDLFRGWRPQPGRTGWLGLLLLLVPPVAGFSTIGLRVFPGATPLLLVVSALLALVNATCEELLWRGAYAAVFPDSLWFGYILPAVGFGVWHLAPQVIFANQMPGGSLSLAGSAVILGLIWGWVTWRSGSIRWTTLSHILMDFSGLGGRIYLG